MRNLHLSALLLFSLLTGVFQPASVFAQEPMKPAYDSNGQLITIPPEQPKSVAIYGFKAHGLTSAQLEIFVRQLNTSLVSSGHFQVLERQRMEVILQEQGFSSTGSTDEAIEMGKMLKVDYIITGSFAKSSGRFYGTADLINTKTAQVEHSSRIDGKSGEPAFITQDIPLLARKIEDPGLILIYPPLKTAAWVTSGVSILALGTGLFFESQAQSSFADFQANPNQRTLSSVEDWQMRRDYAYIAAGTLALGAVVLWFWPEDDLIEKRSSRQMTIQQRLSQVKLLPTLDFTQQSSFGFQIQGDF